MRALQSVKQKSFEIEQMGMSAGKNMNVSLSMLIRHFMSIFNSLTGSFSLGLLNVVVSSFILGRWPEHFWAFTATIVGPMLVWTYLDKVKKGHQLFLLDFCWVANILLSIFSLLCFAQIFGGIEAFRCVCARCISCVEYLSYLYFLGVLMIIFFLLFYHALLALCGGAGRHSTGIIMLFYCAVLCCVVLCDVNWQQRCHV